MGFEEDEARVVAEMERRTTAVDVIVGEVRAKVLDPSTATGAALKSLATAAAPAVVAALQRGVLIALRFGRAWRIVAKERT